MNNSSVKEFLLLGFPELFSVQIALFYAFFVSYVLTLAGNVLIIVATSFSTALRTPMYFFLRNLSFLEILYTSVTIPKMLSNFLNNTTSISFVACAVQAYFFVGLGSTECSLLAVMAYDRYVAVCNPLHYLTLMDPPTCGALVFTCWITGFMNSTVHTVGIFQLNFCVSNIIHQFFCDFQPLLSLACNKQITELVLFIVGGAYGVGSCALILMSYKQIISAIVKIKSKEGQKKAFSTCASHLTVVSLFYGTSLCTYYRPSSVNVTDQEKLTPVVYAVITPMLNPLIYTLRNKEFKMALSKIIQTKLANNRIFK
ncbi:olfactory receptor 5V1-like [Hyperolius riggenbachi]|uniref:olfactory receptor 5V1-like n=1 Tax=Hyperolius riggenbachi TaxID=752182 RepID=UPI0035A36B15